MSMFFPTAEEMTELSPFPGVKLQTCAAERMMISIANLDEGSVVEEHSHPHEQVGMILQGKVRFIIGDEERILAAGDVFRIPGNVKHKVITLEGPAKAIDIFNPIREDYLGDQ